jgi:hypothetical protein
LQEAVELNSRTFANVCGKWFNCEEEEITRITSKM